MKVSYQQTANDDVVRQFRYYLLTLNLPEIAVRFRNAIRRTVQELRRFPRAGSHYRSTNPKLQDLRSWPVVGFEAIRIYYVVKKDTIRVIRILHGKRDIKRILEEEDV